MAQMFKMALNKRDLKSDQLTLEAFTWDILLPYFFMDDEALLSWMNGFNQYIYHPSYELS